MTACRAIAFKAMGGPASIRAFADDYLPLHAARDEVLRIEYKYSRYRDDSIVTRINRSHGAPVAIDAETRRLLAYADDAWRLSEGLFDITSGVLRTVWDFGRRVVPDARALKECVARIGWQRVSVTDEHVTLPPGMEIDFGGFGKEYAVDRAAAVLREHGVANALVDLAGDVAAINGLPDGSPWQVGVRHPRRPQASIARLALHDGAVATSGDYERGFELDGRRYCHILDPRSGQPVSGLSSVSVFHPSCLVAGTLATTAMLHGRGGRAWLDRQHVQHFCVDA